MTGSGSSQPSILRVTAGFVLAPLVIAPLSAISTYLTMDHSPGRYVLPQVLLALAIAYVGTFVMGMPAFLVMQRRRWLSFLHVIVAGAIAGLLFPIAFDFLTGANWFAYSGYSVRFALMWFGTSTAYGAAIACVFWAIALRRQGKIH